MMWLLLRIVYAIWGRPERVIPPKKARTVYFP